MAAGSQGVIPYQGWFQYTGGNITLYGVPSGVSFPHKPTSASTTTTGNASIGAFIYATAGLFYPAGAVDVDVDNVVNNIATPVSVYGTEGTTAQVQVSGENIEGSTGGVGYSYQDLTFGSPFLGGTTIPATSLVAPAISYKVINNRGQQLLGPIPEPGYRVFSQRNAGTVESTASRGVPLHNRQPNRSPANLCQQRRGHPLRLPRLPREVPVCG